MELADRIAFIEENHYFDYFYSIHDHCIFINRYGWK